MSYYLEPDSHIRNKVKVILGMSNYTAKKELEHDTGVDRSDLAAKKDFAALKSELQDKAVKTKVNNLDKKIPDATTLIHTNQQNTDKQYLEEKPEDADKKYQIQVMQ